MPRLSEDFPSAEHWLSVEDFEYLCFNITRELLSYNEPIPDYSTSDKSLLGASLGAPQQTFDRKLLYPTIVEQSSILFYLMIKNHPFKNGNKRITVISLLAFLAINNLWITMTPYDLYLFAQKISESKPEERKEIIKMTNANIKNHLSDYPEKSDLI